MIREATALLILSLVGWLLANDRDAGDGWRLAVALPLGAAAFCTVELVLLSTTLPIARPWWALWLTLLLAVAVAVARRRDGDPSRFVAPDMRALWLFVGAGVVTLVLTAVVPLANVSADSFRYLTMSPLLGEDGDTSRTAAFTLLTRSLSVSALHALAEPELGYLRAFGPLVALSGLASLHLLVREGTPTLDPWTRRALGVAAVVLLLTNHRFLFSAFYLNGHMLFAVWVLLLAGIGWRAVRDPGSATPMSALAAVALSVATTVVRPEGALVVGLVLLPVLVDVGISLRWRQSVLAAFGAGIVLWHAAVLSLKWVDVPASVWGMTALGVGCILAVGLLQLLDGRLGSRPLVVAYGLLWLATAVLGVRSPEILRTVAGPTLRNVLWDGLWGTSLVLLAVLLVVAVALRRVRGEPVLLFPLLSFVPLAVLLAFLRGGGYRVGPGDSLNRMLLHVLPLAVLALAVTAGGDPRAWRSGDRANRSAPTSARSD